jgi:hypothetical protein
MTEAGSAAAEIPDRVRDGVVTAHCLADGLALLLLVRKGRQHFVYGGGRCGCSDTSKN